MSPRPGRTASCPDDAAARIGPMSGRFRFAVLGDPIEHSRSPAIHNAAMQHLGITGGYEAIRAGESQLARAVSELRSGEMDGINVTMPLKGAAARSADFLTPEASAASSVNTLRFRSGRIEGHSSDVNAVRKSMREWTDTAPVLVLGAGGAAAAVIVGSSARTVYLSARDQSKALRLSALIEGETQVVPFPTPVAGAIVVNATPLGMRGEPIPGGLLESAIGLVDLPYGQTDTPAVRSALRLGLPVVDGIEFLTLQAAASFEWWTDTPAPFEIMLSAARKT
jgi:shikimate dehydrogenase